MGSGGVGALGAAGDQAATMRHLSGAGVTNDCQQTERLADRDEHCAADAGRHAFASREPFPGDHFSKSRDPETSQRPGVAPREPLEVPNQDSRRPLPANSGVLHDIWTHHHNRLGVGATSLGLSHRCSSRPSASARRAAVVVGVLVIALHPKAVRGQRCSSAARHRMVEARLRHDAPSACIHDAPDAQSRPQPERSTSRRSTTFVRCLARHVFASARRRRVAFNVRALLQRTLPCHLRPLLPSHRRLRPILDFSPVPFTLASCFTTIRTGEMLHEAKCSRHLTPRTELAFVTPLASTCRRMSPTVELALIFRVRRSISPEIGSDRWPSWTS
jgi:hypothetical protein